MSSHFTRRELVAVVMVAVLVGAQAALGSAAPVPARTASPPTVRGPHLVRPGHRVRIFVSGFRPGSRVRVQFGVYPAAETLNCCVSYIQPLFSHPGFKVNRDGRRTIVVIMPRRWARCVANGCPSPGWRPYRRGQRVSVAAEGNHDYSLYVARVS